VLSYDDKTINNIVHRKFGEVETCGYEIIDMLTERPTDMLVTAPYFTPLTQAE